ncbi:hypothetical protein ACA910_016316 [Epithemia clementina (nom. ined.)]
MVLLFSEDPLDTCSTSSNAHSEFDPDHLSTGDDSSTCSGSLANGASVTPFDQASVEAVPCNPDFFNIPDDEPYSAPTVTGNADLSHLTTTNGTQSCRQPLLVPTLYKCSNVFKLPLSKMPKVKTVALLWALVDWHNTFCSEFHFALHSDPAAWSAFKTSFRKVLTPLDLQKFLDCEFKNSATAFLSVDCCGNVVMIHNLLLLPGTGTLFSMTLQFLCLSCLSFSDTSPHLLDPNNIPALLNHLSALGTPTAKEILNACIILSSTTTSNKLQFSFCQAKWKALFTSPPDHTLAPNQDPHQFTCTSILPIPLALAAILLKYLNLLSKIALAVAAFISMAPWQ